MTDSTSKPATPPTAGESLDTEILRLLMETIPDRIYFKDLESRFVRVNEAQARGLGAKTPAEVVGKTDFDYYAVSHARTAFAIEQEIIRTGQPSVGFIERLETKDGRVTWASATKLAWRDSTGRIIGTFGLTRDHTEAKQIEEKLEHERNLLRTIIDHLPSRIFVKDTEGRYVINNRSHLSSLGAQAQEEAVGRTTAEFHPGLRGQQSMADDRSVLSGGPPILNKERSDFGEEGRTRWALTTKVPLRDARGRIVGLVGISHDITARKRVEDELRQRSEEMEADVRMARQIQEVFLPRVYPVFPRGVPAAESALHFAHRYVPTATLGGDFFDVIQLSDTQCGVLVCDVMGHGVRAGLLTALIRGVVGELGPRAASPAFVLAEINRGLTPILRATGQPVFTTAFYALVDCAAGTLLHANAGHPPPLLLRGSDGPVEPLGADSPEPAAGLLEGFVYTEKACPFGPGDRLLGFTDGLFEASDWAGAIFGEERLRSLVAQQRAQPSAKLIDRLLAEVQAFTGRNEFEDDICVVAIESTGLVATEAAATHEI